jgi:hypothetical protein
MDENFRNAYEYYMRQMKEERNFDEQNYIGNENYIKNKKLAKGCRILIEMIALRAIFLKNPNMVSFNIRHEYAHVYHWNGVYIMKNDTILCTNNNKVYKAPSTFVSDHKRLMASKGIYRGDNTKIQSNGWVEAKILIDNERFRLGIYRALKKFNCI